MIRKVWYIFSAAEEQATGRAKGKRASAWSKDGEVVKKVFTAAQNTPTEEKVKATSLST